MVNKIFNPEHFHVEDRDQFVEELKLKALILNHGRLLQVLINNFAEKKYLEKLYKREGQEIQIDFPAYDTRPNCLTFVLSKSPSDPYMKPSENPKATIIFSVKEENLVPTLVDIISTNYGVFGVLKIFFKYLFTGKIRYKPKWAIGALLAVLRCFLVGKNDMILENPLKKEAKQ